MTSTKPTGATLVEKIAGAMGEAGEVTKSEENREQGYKFASAEAMLKAVRGPLFERGVILTPELGEVDEQEITARSGTKGTRVIVHVTFRFADGETELSFAWRGEGQDYGDKAYGKAYTNAIKTFIRTAWLLPTEHDDPEKDRPTERAGNAGGDCPRWAQKASRETLAGLEPLAGLLGNARAADLLRSLRNALGGIIPDAVVLALLSMHGETVASLSELGYLDSVAAERQVFDEQAAKDAADRANAAAADKAVEAADPNPPERPAAANDAEADALAAESRYAPAPADGVEDPAAGSVPAPELADDTPPLEVEQAYRDAGCTCQDPGAAALFEALKAQGKDAQAAKIRPLVDDACPIAGHGIGF